MTDKEKTIKKIKNQQIDKFYPKLTIIFGIISAIAFFKLMYSLIIYLMN